MAAQEKFCLRWNDFETNISVAFRELREDKDFFDVTLACEDDQIQAHKVILSACSPFFRTVLKRNPHEKPLLYLKGVRYLDIVAVLNFMYHGEVNVAQEDLNTFLAVAEDLQVKGLTQNNTEKISNHSNTPKSPEKVDRIETLPTPKRFKPSIPTQHKPVIQQEDDIQEVVPIKSEPINSQPNDNQLDHIEPEVNYGASGRGELVAETDDYENDYADYNYEAEAAYNDNSMMVHNMSGNSDGIDRGPQTSPGNSKNMYTEVEGPNGKIYQCLICHRSVNLMQNMKKHLETHAPESAVPCNYCGSMFKTRNSMMSHVSRKHRQYQ